MNIIQFLVDFVIHIDVHLAEFIATYGTLTYALIFGIIFVETGLVFTPFLPGDSLLFVAGAFAALKSLNLFILLPLLMAAAILGDTANYWIGHYLGEKIVSNPRMPINRKHLEKTHKFFERYGGKTIIMARFVPFVRTFAPFVAGAGSMSYGKFLLYNIVGGCLWVAVGTVAGYFFGNIHVIKDNFTLFILAIIFVSFIPMIIPVLRGLRKKKQPPDTQPVKNT
jgi:membrane-associated protein